ncbi:YycH family regulatory protein [Paenisporosarcina sp. TG20]|uniref:YycH family regulatory protein n=1 Tax=Paenisporosarcina sp. TG20 TaxID=1211706 RepID=UPI0002EA32EA|nr:two-component system activity regulator YycH [Paenisporosarcina sp. TG20]
MGLRYVEQTKSVILTLLVFLSITLTFTIWTYTPTYETNQQPPVVNISIAEQKRINDVIKPYKMIVNQENKLTGSMVQFDLDLVVSIMKDWELRELKLENNNLDNDNLNKLMTTDNGITLFFQDNVPFSVYDRILPFSITDIPESSFDRLIVNWGQSDSENLKIYFASSKTNTLYSAIAENVDMEIFKQKVVSPNVNFSEYVEVKREGKLSLFLIEDDVESIRYTYYLKEIDINRFRDALFNDPNLVRQSPVGANHAQYSDGTALMDVNLLEHTLSFVNPSSEIFTPAIPSKLVFDSLDFVNEHGGWTDDFRFAGINPINQQIDYQLFLLGYPVFSGDTSTKITAYWGSPGIYNYLRPYYTLDLSLPFDTVISNLASGEKVSRALNRMKEIDFNNIDEITLGYYLTRDNEQRLLILEPTWFYLSNNIWTRFVSDDLGGE